MKLALAFLLLPQVAFAVAGAPVEIDWSEARPGDALLIRLRDGTEARGTLRYRVAGSDGESLVLLDDLQIRRSETASLARLAPGATDEQHASAPDDPATGEPPAPTVNEPAVERPPVERRPRRFLLAVDAGAAYHSFDGVGIWGGTLALAIGGGRDPVAITFRSSLFAGATPEHLSFVEAEFGPALYVRVDRVHIGVEPFLGVLAASRVTSSLSSVTGALVGLALSIACDLAHAGNNTFSVATTGKIASSGNVADTWELALTLGVRYSL